MRTGSWVDRTEDLREFWTRRIWDARLRELPRTRALRYRVARLTYCAARGLFWSAELTLQSAALTYYTVLSLVPLLAFAFAVLKGLGAYESLVETSIRPYVEVTFDGNPQLRQAIEQVLGFVERTNVASLGVVGLLFVMYTATRLLRNVEDALNGIWDVPSGRGPLRQITDYVAIIVVTPVLLMLATALATAVQAIGIVRSLGDKLGVASTFDTLLGTLGPLVVILFGLTFLYLVMPNTDVRPKSAAVGALVGGVLWYGALVLHVKFQLGVANYNALYSGFGALPIFLVWLQVSWLTIMVGAQVAATHQHERLVSQTRRVAEMSSREKEAVGLAAALSVARDFLRVDQAPTTEALSEELDAPPMLVLESLRRLASRGIVAETGAPQHGRWLLARPADTITVKQVLDALREMPPSDEELRLPALSPLIDKLLSDMDRAQEASSSNRTLHELVSPSERVARQERPAEGNGHQRTPHRG